MGRVVPSQIVTLIDQNSSETKSATTRVGHGSVAVLMAIVRLIEELPAELLGSVNIGKLANDVVDARSLQAYLRHRNIQNTTRLRGACAGPVQGILERLGRTPQDGVLRSGVKVR